MYEALIVEAVRRRIEEGVDDPDILKAVFMAGGGGSGKSWVAMNMFGGTGLRVVNCDDILEAMARDPGLRQALNVPKAPGGRFQKFDLSDPAQIGSAYVQGPMRAKAKQLKRSRLEMYLKERLGVLIDGTGDDPEKVGATRKRLIGLGYDCGLLYVSTPVKVALQRNASRTRMVPEEFIIAAHKAIRDSIPKYKAMFGQDFMEVANDEDIPKEQRVRLMKVTADMRRMAMRWLRKPLRNPIGRAWVESRGGKPR